MKKKKKIILIVLIIIIILSIITFFLYHSKMKNKTPEVKVIEVLDKIKDYDYFLEDRDTETYKTAFYELKDILKEEPIDYQKYSESIAKLFLIDLYTINNKISKYDVGSIDFVSPKDKNEFQNKVMDTLYKLVKDNSTNNRNQELPEVINVSIENVTPTKYQIDDDTSLEAFEMNATITYQKDLGYDKIVKVTVAKDKDKVFVVNLTSSNEK